MSYGQGLRHFVITYDIACKYGVNFAARCFNEDVNEALIPTPDGPMNIAFCVNKFHQESHDANCRTKNALNYTKFVGRTCGEGVETIWAALNYLRYSSREMTRGGREELLSEHFNDWNWQKIIGIGTIAAHLLLPWAQADMVSSSAHEEDLRQDGFGVQGSR